MAEHEQVLNAAGACGQKIAREPIDWRVRIFAHRIGIDDHKVRAAEIEFAARAAFPEKLHIDAAGVALCMGEQIAR